jgi:regulator of RNase E activity RraA
MLLPRRDGQLGLPERSRRGRTAACAGEVTLDAGDLVMGDRDGVVIVPKGHVCVIADRLEKVAALEAEMHAQIARGEIRTLLDRWPELRDQISYLE